MTPRRAKTFRMRPPPAEPLRVQNPRAAGIDVHAAQHWVAVPPEAAPQALTAFQVRQSAWKRASNSPWSFSSRHADRADYTSPAAARAGHAVGGPLTREAH